MYVLLAKPVYEVKSIIEMAQIDKKVVQQPVDLALKIGFIYEVDLKGKEIELPVISAVSVPKKSSNLIEIRAQGYSNESAQKKLEEAIDFVVSAQEKEIVSFTQMQREKSALVEQDIIRKEKEVQVAEAKLKIYEEKLLNLAKSDGAMAGVYAIVIEKNQTELNELKDKIYELKDSLNDLVFSISPLMIQNAKMAGGIELLDEPVKPKKTLIIAAAFITGLMLSVFLTFFLEFLKGEKRERQ
jgi:LPS O-antigen subunit length determinant protein (WzzB/FepE family)